MDMNFVTGVERRKQLVELSEGSAIEGETVDNWYRSFFTMNSSRDVRTNIEFWVINGIV